MTETKLYHVIKRVDNDKMMLFGVFTNRTIMMNVLKNTHNMSEFYFLNNDKSKRIKSITATTIGDFLKQENRSLTIYNSNTNVAEICICQITLNNVNPIFKELNND